MSALRSRLAGFGRDERAAALVEFSVVASVFFLAFFVAIDFGRLGFRQVATEAAMRMAVRTAVVRPPVCAAFDATGRYARPQVTTSPPPRFGTSCKVAGACAAFATVSCAGSATNTTANEIWTRVAPLLPAEARIEDLRFTYSYDPDLGFLGGRYVPLVTVALANGNTGDGLDPTRFQFISPVSASGGLTLPISASMPGEDLCQSDGGAASQCSGTIP